VKAANCVLLGHVFGLPRRALITGILDHLEVDTGMPDMNILLCESLGLAPDRYAVLLKVLAPELQRPRGTE